MSPSSPAASLRQDAESTRGPQLPIEIVMLVLQAVYDHDAFNEDGYCWPIWDRKAGDALLRGCLQVNTTFDLAAAPILFGRPRVHKLGAFFLGADRPVPPHILSMEPGPASDLRYIKHGNTKPPLLRRLRHLSACPKGLSKARKDTRIVHEMTKSLREATTTLQAIKSSPTTFTPTIPPSLHYHRSGPHRVRPAWQSHCQ
ncbi:hypothetical protein IAT38_003462 [Cryptococcus sp. DSM 104549]